MKTIYRGDQEALISRLSGEYNVSPTQLLFTLAKLLDDKTTPIATLVVQEITNGKFSKERD